MQNLKLDQLEDYEGSDAGFAANDNTPDTSK